MLFRDLLVIMLLLSRLSQLRPSGSAASSIMISQGHREQEPYRAMWERRRADIPDDVSMITPDIPAEPRGIYGCTKVWTESLARTYAHRHKISCICVRIGQVVRDRPRPPKGADIFVSQRDIVQIIERCINADAAFNGAGLLAESLYTIPTHSQVSARDLDAIVSLFD